MKRFIDENLTLSDFTNVVLVICPKCRGKAECHNKGDGLLKCLCRCGYYKEKSVNDFATNELWLQKIYKGHLFWAINNAHLAYLKQYIQASVRESKRERKITDIKNQTMASRLPKFIKSHKNRDDLLKIIAQLENKREP